MQMQTYSMCELHVIIGSMHRFCRPPPSTNFSSFVCNFSRTVSNTHWTVMLWPSLTYNLLFFTAPTKKKRLKPCGLTLYYYFIGAYMSLLASKHFSSMLANFVYWRLCPTKMLFKEEQTHGHDHRDNLIHARRWLWENSCPVSCQGTIKMTFNVLFWRYELT